MYGIYQSNSGHRSSRVARTSSVSAAIALALLIGASAARAQQSGASEAAPQGKEEIGEIIVTARRREERIQDVPISITALPQEALEKNNIQDYEQLQFKAPALHATFCNLLFGVKVPWPWVRNPECRSILMKCPSLRASTATLEEV